MLTLESERAGTMFGMNTGRAQMPDVTRFLSCVKKCMLGAGKCSDSAEQARLTVKGGKLIACKCCVVGEAGTHVAITATLATVVCRLAILASLLWEDRGLQFVVRALSLGLPMTARHSGE